MHINITTIIRRIFCAAAAGIAALILQCSFSPDNKITESRPEEGSATETVGIVYKSDLGFADAAHIIVISASNVPGQTPLYADTLITDSNGRYRLNSLPADTYNLFFEKDSMRAFRSGLEVDSAGKPIISDTIRDTLGATGSFTAIIGMKGGHDPRTVSVLIIGTTMRADPDSTGAFTLSAMAPGTYRTRFLPAHDDYKVKDTTLEIFSAIDTIMSDTIWLDYAGIMPVEMLACAYDSMMQIAALTWSGLSLSAVSGYNIYRKATDSVSWIQLNATLHTETSFSDSNAFQDKSYYYRVIAVDSSGTEAETWSQTGPVTISSAYELARIIGEQGPDSGQFHIPVGLIVKDDMIYVLEQGNKRIQVLDAQGNCMRIFGIYGPHALVEPTEIAIFSDTLYVADYGGLIKLYNLEGSEAGIINVSGMDIVDLAVLSPDSIYVVDANNRSISLIDMQGIEITKSTNAFLDGPMKIALQNETVTATSGDARTIQIFDMQLTFKSEYEILQKEFNKNTNIAVASIAFDNNSCLLGIRDYYTWVYELDMLTGNILSRFRVANQIAAPLQDKDFYISTSHDIFVLTNSGTIQIFKRR